MCANDTKNDNDDHDDTQKKKQQAVESKKDEQLALDINGTGRCFVFVLQLLVFVLHHLMPSQPLISTEGYRRRDLGVNRLNRDKGKKARAEGIGIRTQK